MKIELLNVGWMTAAAGVWCQGEQDPGRAARIPVPAYLVETETERILGDGSVELLSTPGHTPGHQSVRVGEIVIGADVAHFAGVLDDHRFPAFGDDFEEQRRSAERLRDLREAGMRVQPGHDPDVLAPRPIKVEAAPER